jgi:hypothetical protein
MAVVKRQLNGETLKLTAVAAAPGWFATVTSERLRPVVLWALLQDGEGIGLVEEAGEFVSAEQVRNFSGFRHERQ